MTVEFPERFNLADYFLFDRLAEGLGGKAALLYGDRLYTYDQVARRSRGVCQLLLGHTGGAGERVYLVLPDGPAFAWSFFGALSAGAVVTLGNPDAPSDDLAGVIDYVGAAVVITVPRVAEALRARTRCTFYVVPETETGGDPEGAVDERVLDGRRVRALAPSVEAAMDMGEVRALTPRPIHRDDPAIWLFTSGSTGKPKAAMHAHRDFAFNTEVYAKRTVGYRGDDITVSVPRLYFGYATGTNLMFPFAVGATVGLYSERPTPEALASAIAKYRPTVITNVPTLMGKLLDHDDALAAAGQARLDLSSVRFHLSAGEALPPPLLARFSERFGNPVYDGIGSAEMFHIYASNRPGDCKPGSLGKVVEGYSIRILPDDAEGPGAPPLPPNETGVMWVKGDSVALGYHQDRDKSWKTFSGHWCRTGDLFRVDEEGYLWFSGRADELIKVSGLWVSPTEVEACLMSHPAVTLAAVIGVLDEGLMKPKAFVVAREQERAALATDEGRAALRSALQEHVKAQLQKHKYPRVIEFVDDLPRNDRGKVDRKALKRGEASGAGSP